METAGKREVAVRPDRGREVLGPIQAAVSSRGRGVSYKWHWLVDGLRALKYRVVLASPAGMEQYSGIRHADDTNDAFFLADLLRLKICRPVTFTNRRSGNGNAGHFQAV